MHLKKPVKDRKSKYVFVICILKKNMIYVEPKLCQVLHLG